MVVKANGSSEEGRPARISRLWLLWLVLVAGANFYLGVLVGRGTSPLRFDIQALQKEIAALRDTEMKTEVERFRALMDGSANSQPLDFYTVLKQDNKPLPAPVPADKAVSQKPPAAKPAPVAAAFQKPATAKPGPVVGEPQKPPVVKPVPASPEAAAPPTPKPPEAGPPKKAKGPSVQVAALREAEAAERVVSRLAAQGFAARSVRIQTAERGVWYRVRVGPFNDRQAADQARDRLSRLNYQAIVVEP